MKMCAYRLMIALALIGLCVGRALAWPLIGIDASIEHASDPFTVRDPSALGIDSGNGVGVNFDLNRTSQYAKVVARVDIKYFRWSSSEGYVSSALMRVPLFLGARVYMPYGTFVDGGVAFTYDTLTARYTGPLYGITSPGRIAKNSYLDTKLAPGIGVEYPIIGKVTLGAHARYHIRMWSGVDGYSVYGLDFCYHF